MVGRCPATALLLVPWRRHRVTARFRRVAVGAVHMDRIAVPLLSRWCRASLPLVSRSGFNPGGGRLLGNGGRSQSQIIHLGAITVAYRAEPRLATLGRFPAAAAPAPDPKRTLGIDPKAPGPGRNRNVRPRVKIASNGRLLARRGISGCYPRGASRRVRDCRGSPRGHRQSPALERQTPFS